jgi:3',5'-cyclic AMP phosphodiesterase CpdA
MTKIAILADPHFHDVDYDPANVGGRLTAVRTFADTAASTRVFNESGPALKATLDDIAGRDIRLVVIAGDLTDDGQVATTASAAALLDEYTDRHGLRFFLTPGNHDLFALHGRHQTKRFLNPDGSHFLVTSDENAAQGDSVRRVVRDDFYCHGYEGALNALKGFGYFRGARDLHWETPFGESDSLSERTYRACSTDGLVSCDMVDASYLVEPVAGVWLLSIDANVFVPRVGATDLTKEASFHDSTDAGWRELVRHKAHLLTWMRDVAGRAKAQGKRLLTFSHYPALDALNGTLAKETALFGETGFARRTPSSAVADEVAGTGIKVHFSGHLHVNDTAVHYCDDGFLVNVAMPSLVGFAPAYKIAELTPGRIDVETIPVHDIAGYDLAFASYAREAGRLAADYGHSLGAKNHGGFMNRHLDQLVSWRYLAREWPREIADLVAGLSVEDLFDLALGDKELAPGEVMAFVADRPKGGGLGPTFSDLIGDWYRLRKGSQMALDFISAERIAACRELMVAYRRRNWKAGSFQSWVADFLRMMGMYLEGPPSRNFSIDLATGQVEATLLSRADGFAPDGKGLISDRVEV